MPGLNKTTKSIIRFSIIMLLCLHRPSVHAQPLQQTSSGSLIGKPYIQWVGEWPEPGGKMAKSGFKEQFTALLFGKRNPVPANPLTVLAYSESHFLFTDQGATTLFEVKDKLGDIPQSVGRSDLPFSALVGICAGPDESVFFADARLRSVFRIDKGARRLITVVDSNQLLQPAGIVFNPLTREIWVSDTKSHMLKVFSEGGELLRTIGSRGTGDGEFNFPGLMCIDNKGTVYVVDAMNFRIQMFNASGEFIGKFGEPGDASGYFARPKGIAVDSYGHIYISDALFHAVQVFDSTGVLLYRFGNQGHGNGEFWVPSGISIDSQNFIYVADTYNARIQIFQFIQKEEK